MSSPTPKVAGFSVVTLLVLAVGQFLVGLEAVELQGGFAIGNSRLPLAQLLELGLHLIELAHLGLGLLLVIPEVGLGGQLLEVLLPGFQCRDVKDSPVHCTGGQ